MANTIRYVKQPDRILSAVIASQASQPPIPRTNTLTNVNLVQVYMHMTFPPPKLSSSLLRTHLFYEKALLENF